MSPIPSATLHQQEGPTSHPLKNNTANPTNGGSTPTNHGQDDLSPASLIEQLRSALSSQGSSTKDDAYDRAKVKELAIKLSIALETPGETLARVAYYVGPSPSTLFCRR